MYMNSSMGFYWYKFWHDKKEKMFLYLSSATVCTLVESEMVVNRLETTSFAKV